MNEFSLIIDQPDLQPRRMRAVYAILTGLFWAVWIYLWLPVASLIAWAVGIRFFFIEMLLPANFDYLHNLFIYTQVGIALLLVILAWSRYNRFRFSGRDRRRATRALTASDEAAYHGLDIEHVLALKGARLCTVRYDLDDRLQMAFIPLNDETVNAARLERLLFGETQKTTAVVTTSSQAAMETEGQGPDAGSREADPVDRIHS